MSKKKSNRLSIDCTMYTVPRSSPDVFAKHLKADWKADPQRILCLVQRVGITDRSGTRSTVDPRPRFDFDEITTLFEQLDIQSFNICLT